MSARKFIGGKVPLFGSKAAPKPDSYQRRSPWYWWYEVLRRSERYARFPEGTAAQQQLYADFGDVRKESFKVWWKSRSETLFAEPPGARVEIVTSCTPSQDEIYLRIPLYLPKRFIKARVAALINSKHGGRHGQRIFKSSRAKYPLRQRCDVRAVEIALHVYDERKNSPDMTWWEIGQKVKVAPPRALLKPNDGPADARDKKLRLANLSLRYFKRAKELIADAERGLFP